MKNFQNSMDLSSDLEIVENFEVESAEDVHIDILSKEAITASQDQEKIIHICDLYTSIEIDLQYPPPEG